mmetsp:Transcript_16339/g.46486  ORF Transcript_16339/g.46486 Transcript_16339/m.46486 type:complete len:116 (+) Transcript_16339:826-1173(+)
MSVMYEKYGPAILQQTNEAGQTALFAAQFDNAAAVAQLLEWEPKLLDGRGNDGATPFHYAAYEGSVHALEAMFAKGGKYLLKQKTKPEGHTALHIAANKAWNGAAGSSWESGTTR